MSISENEVSEQSGRKALTPRPLGLQTRLSAKTKMHRRQILRGAGVAALAPFVPILESEAQTNRQRFVTWYTPTGTIQNEWVPEGNPQNYSFKRILKPVEPYKDRMIVFLGLKFNGGGSANQHHRAPSLMFSGDNVADGGGGWGLGTSIDQNYAKLVGDQTPFPSLVLGVIPGPGGRLARKARISYRGPGQPITPEYDPSKVFDQIFGGFEEDPQAAALLRAQEQSVLDIVQTQLTSFKSKHSTLDAMKLDAHLTSVRGIERRLNTAQTSCGGAEDPNANAKTAMVERAQAMFDVMAAALSCDITRTISMQLAQEGGGETFPWLNINTAHHKLTHSGNAANVQEQLIKTYIFWSEQLAYFMGKLDEVPEAGGTLLDNTLIYAGSGMSQGSNHRHVDVPIMLAGGVGGKLPMGRLIAVPDVLNNRLLVSVSQTLGMNVNKYGGTDQGSGPLVGL